MVVEDGCRIDATGKLIITVRLSMCALFTYIVIIYYCSKSSSVSLASWTRTLKL